MWSSPSFPQIHQKYIYIWNNSYRTPTEHWQKNSDFPKGKELPTYLGRAKEKRKNRDKRIGMSGKWIRQGKNSGSLPQHFKLLLSQWMWKTQGDISNFQQSDIKLPLKGLCEIPGVFFHFCQRISGKHLLVNRIVLNLLSAASFHQLSPGPWWPPPRALLV